MYGCLGCLKMERVGPVSTMWPACMIATRSAFAATVPRSCVINRMATFVLRLISLSRSKIWTSVVTSRPVVGSSAMRRRGCAAIIRAIRARWTMPPLNSCG